MAEYHTKIDVSKGINTANLSESSFKFIKDFSILNLIGENKFSFDPSPFETGILIFEGTFDIEIDGKFHKDVGSRDNVFSGLPTAVYIPTDTPFTCSGSNASIAICRAECSEKTEPAVIMPDQVKVMDVGEDNWSREVRILIGPDSPSVNMIVGETINPPGNWSGTPPHKHEGDKSQGESRQEELYYFKTDKPQGWGIERFYSPARNVNELIYLKENSITFMPWGYHQIVAAPGYTLYYLFFLAGEGKDLSPFEDPEHNWIKNDS